MYPEIVHFHRVTTGASGAMIEWTVQDGLELAHLDLWIAPEAVESDESEAFYRGDLRRRMRCVRLPPDSRAFTDPDAEPMRWCTLFGVLGSGHLVALPFHSRPLDGLAALPPEARDGASFPRNASRLASPPDLVFRDDDPRARVMIRASAAAMAGG